MMIIAMVMMIAMVTTMMMVTGGSQLLSRNDLLGAVPACYTAHLSFSLTAAHPGGTITHICRDEEATSESLSSMPRTPQLISDGAGAGLLFSWVLTPQPGPHTTLPSLPAEELWPECLLALPWPRSPGSLSLNVNFLRPNNRVGVSWGGGGGGCGEGSCHPRLMSEGNSSC